MKRYVARSTGGNGMTHWYEYWTGNYWSSDISQARFYERTYTYIGQGPDRRYAWIEVELTIKEKA